MQVLRVKLGVNIKGAQQGNTERLPPEAWGHILEYSTYKDVARMARVSTIFLHQVMPVLKTLYFESDDEPSVAHARRFQGGLVKEIIVDCVFYDFGTNSTHGSTTYFKVSEWAANGKLATFLSNMPSVKTVLLGNGTGESKTNILDRLGLQECYQGESRTYLPKQSFEEEQEQSFLEGDTVKRSCGDLSPAALQVRLFASLIHSLCNAYVYESISQSMHIFGLPGVHDHGNDCFFADGCDLCEGMSAVFPLEQVLSLKKGPKSYYFPGRLGNALDVKALALVHRPDAAEAMLARQVDLFRDLLQSCEVVFLDYGESMAIIYEKHVLQAMMILQSHGYDPGLVVDATAVALSACSRAMKAVSESADCGAYVEYTEPIPIMEDTYEALVNEIGFSLDPDVFEIVSSQDDLVL